MAFSWLRVLGFASTLLQATGALELPKYTALKTALEGNVLRVTFHNPNSTINLWGEATTNDMTDLVSRLQKDNDTKVVIFNSDVPRWFIAHVDLSIPNVVAGIPAFAELLYNVSSLPQVTIGAVEGRARGGGNEFLVALDMRFATKNDTLFGQLEVGVGLLPGGGGNQFLPGLIGRGLAMEYILSAKDISATEAEKIGWINKAFDTTADMNAYINTLVNRLRLFPLSAISRAKTAVNRRSAPSKEDVVSDAISFGEQIVDPIVAQINSGGPTSEAAAYQFELNIGENLLRLYNATR